MWIQAKMIILSKRKWDHKCESFFPCAKDEISKESSDCPPEQLKLCWKKVLQSFKPELTLFGSSIAPANPPSRDSPIFSKCRKCHLSHAEVPLVLVKVTRKESCHKKFKAKPDHIFHTSLPRGWTGRWVLGDVNENTLELAICCLQKIMKANVVAQYTHLERKKKIQHYLCNGNEAHFFIWI